MAVLARPELLVVVGVLGGDEGLDQSSDGGGGQVLSHATEFANNLLHALLAAQNGAVHVLDTLGKVVDGVRFFSHGTLLPLDIHNSGEEEGEADDGQDNGNKWEDSGSDLAVGTVGGSGIVGVGGRVVAVGRRSVASVGRAVAGVGCAVAGVGGGGAV